MSNIVIALPKIEDAKKIRMILERHGLQVLAICNTAASALSKMSELDDGILICGYRFSDMMYFDVQDCLPRGVEMLLLISRQNSQEVPPSILKIEMPMKELDLINTVNMMFEQIMRKRKKNRQKPKARDDKDKKVINEAKLLLMDRNHLSEEEAHRYIQKCSMDSGTNMVETAQMILLMIGDA